MSSKQSKLWISRSDAAILRFKVMEHLGSVYVGDYANKRMEGNGSYKLPTGSIYVGEMKDGMYHGVGKITYPDGGQFGGIFSKGYPVSLVLNCTKNLTAKSYFKGAENLADGPKRGIPDGYYDIGDGFYDPQTRTVYDYKMRFLRNADVAEHEWAITHGRKGWDEFTRGQPNLCRPELSDPRLNDLDWNKLNEPESYLEYVRLLNARKH
ncbi:MORN repeat-containing protein [Echinococcus granulosus]|uniref:MORN repeat-containing protein 5 n=1 Tax=Echinococcus granulosus TaxID=6210 RepID=W6VAH0_ECHGR|nr:MORN repeat-containing protein [Echinococcus granulosus]EUB63779.1 MORN repeat-containing protein [Echinococcus granulosus]